MMYLKKLSQYLLVNSLMFSTTKNLVISEKNQIKNVYPDITPINNYNQIMSIFVYCELSWSSKFIRLT